MHTLNWKNRIAAAVALEALRVAAGQQPAAGQGAAYKAEWDRRGSDALKLCHDMGTDAARMAGLARLTHVNGGRLNAAHNFAVLEAARP